MSGSPEGPLVALLAVWYSFGTAVGPIRADRGSLEKPGAVAQLVRVPDCRSGGCGFESRPRRLF